MGACWRAFAALPGVQLSHVIAFKVGAGEQSVAFNEEVMSGLSYHLLDARQKNDSDHLCELIAQQKPDIVVLPGWFHRAYTSLVSRPELHNVRFVMTMDTPFTGSVRQIFGRVKAGRFLDKMSGVICGGERAFQLARWLKVPERKLLRGLYGFDSIPLEVLYQQRVSLPGGWPRKFVYVGRFVDDKAIDVLVQGYQIYRKTVADPWPLECFGRGEDQRFLKDVEGIVDNGFIQPKDLPRALREAGVYVIASRYEPWGVSIAEAAYSGLPILCTMACGAAVELVRHLHSGYICPTESAVELANGMSWLHSNHSLLPEFGHNGIALARPFDMNCWAQRWHHFLSHTVLQSPVHV